MGHAPGIVYRCIVRHLIRKAGFCRKMAETGAVTLNQRFGSALHLNVHFHMPKGSWKNGRVRAIRTRDGFRDMAL